MTIQELKELALHAVKRTAPSEFSVDSVDQALLDGFKALCGDSINTFMKNRYDVYEIISRTADVVVPDRVIDAMGAFAEVISVPQGSKVAFKRGPLGRNRAKKFLTQVGLSGVYETARLDQESFELPVQAIGGAITMDFERFLDGAENLAELMDVITEAQVDAIYSQVQAALIAAASSSDMPANNKVLGSYTAAGLQKIINTVKTYGGAATVFAAPEFISAMGPDAIVPTLMNSTTNVAQGIYAPEDISDIHRYGIIKIFRGTPVVELRQSFADETNTKVMINPQYAYVLPSGKEKVVKVAMEGATQMYDFTNRDNSIEIHTYRKIGVGILTYNNWGVYQNTGIDASNWYNPSL